MNENIQDILAEQPGGDNGGRVNEPVRVKDDDVSATRGTPLDGVTADFLRGDGWQTASAEGGRQLEQSGLTTHRGVLHPDEYVDFFELREQVEADFGFTYAEVSAAYKQGRPTAEQRQLREKIDARLLALSRAGGNMDQLGKALGLPERTLDSALARAREIDVQPMVPHGTVKSTFACFKCGEPGTKRKRRFSDSPAQWVGTVVLCDEHYAAGFVTKPGNPAYWEHRDARMPLRGQGLTPSPKVTQTFPADYPDDESYRRFTEGREIRV